MRIVSILALALATAACGAPNQPAPQSAASAAPATVSDSAPPIAMEPAADKAPAPAKSAAPAAKGVAASWTVDSAHSAISFTGKHKTIGPFSATFKGWTAQIVFDPADLPHSKVAVTIPTAGVKTGQQIIDSAWPETEWFDVKNHPNATFTATSFKSLGGGKFEAAGTLNIKGKAYPESVPFTLTINGDAADAVGALTIDRTELDIGMQSDSGAEWVDKSVTVNIKLHAMKG